MGALISCPTSIVLAYKFGPKAEEYLHESKIYMLIFVGLIAAYGIYHYISHRQKPPPPPGGPATPPQMAASSDSGNSPKVERAEMTK
jgi:hypothetical protein